MQTIEVPGLGPVQFPDNMDDLSIEAAIKRHLLDASPSGNMPAPAARTPLPMTNAADLGQMMESHDPALNLRPEGQTFMPPQSPGGLNPIPPRPGLAKRFISGEPGHPGFPETVLKTPLDVAKIANDSIVQMTKPGPDRAFNMALGVVGGPGAGPAKAAKGIKGGMLGKLLSPSTVDDAAERAAALVRKETGTAARATETTRAALEPFQRPVNKLNDPLPMIGYIENRSAGANPLPDPTLQKAADQIRTEYQKRRVELEGMSATEQMNFVEDYYTHAWKDQKKAQEFVRNWYGGGKEGSGKNLKQRSIPTIADGIAAGLEPVSVNPLETTMAYADNMDKFIAHNKIHQTAVDNGDITYHVPGTQPEGTAEIKGRFNQKVEPAPVGPGHNESGGFIVKKAYAPEGFARVYNNYISRGVHEMSADIGKVYDTLRHGSNALTQLELGLSGYHALTMTQEGIVDGMARGIDELFHGQPLAGAKSIGRAVAAPVTNVIKGHKLQNVYLGKTQGTPMQKEIADIVTEAGARPVGIKHAPDYEMTGTLGSFWTSLRRGSLKTELAADANQAMSGLGGFAKVAARNIGRTLQTVAQPVFEQYIPKLKTGALSEHIASWMKGHPDATHDEVVAAARYFSDLLDGRFGEMVQDNVFLHKAMKQALTLGLRSWSWSVGGDIQTLGGAIADTAGAPIRGVKKLAGKGAPVNAPPGKHVWTPKMSYAIALPVTYGLAAAVYQYLKTGEAPKDIQDLLGPRTGGVNPPNHEGIQTPERLQMPGYMKDVFGFIDDPLGEAGNKVSAGFSRAKELVTNHDWRGDPILGPGDPQKSWIANVPTWLQQWGDYAMKTVPPISIRNWQKGQKQGSNISGLEATLGVKTAPPMIQDPKGHADLMRYLSAKEWAAKQAFDAKQAALYGPAEARTKDDTLRAPSRVVLPDGTRGYKDKATGKVYPALPKADEAPPTQKQIDKAKARGTSTTTVAPSKSTGMEHLKTLKDYNEKGALWQEMQDLGIPIDGRYSADHLRKMIAAARAAKERTYGGTQ